MIAINNAQINAKDKLSKISTQAAVFPLQASLQELRILLHLRSAHQNASQNCALHWPGKILRNPLNCELEGTGAACLGKLPNELISPVCK